MLLHSIATNLRKQNWSVLSLELLVVVIGLVLAFQVDRWWEERGERVKEQEYINRLISEVREDTELISYASELAEVRKGFAELLIDVADNPAVVQQQPAMFLAAVAQAPFTYTPSLVSHTFEDLRSTGTMGLIRNGQVKSALYDYYGFHDAQQQFIQLNLMIEQRFFELSADVLTAEQYMWVQDYWFVVTANDLNDVRNAEVVPDGVQAAVERYISNDELVAWVPRTRGIQVEQMLMNGIRLSRAENLLEQLTAYAAELEND